MNEWRITKYEPRYRNRSGAYLREEWTSVTDIGKTFNGQAFTVQQYLDMEERYISAVVHFLRESDLSSLSVIGLETDFPIPAQLERLGLTDLLSKRLELETGDQLSLREIELVCRLNLRELVWCKLEAQNRFYIHFGYDYYMYIGSAFSCTESISYACRLGLFVENHSSPY